MSLAAAGTVVAVVTGAGEMIIVARLFGRLFFYDVSRFSVQAVDSSTMVRTLSIWHPEDHVGR